MKLKLLIVLGQLRAGGLERQVCYLLESIDRKECSPALAVWSYHDDDFHVARIRSLGIPIYGFDPHLAGFRKLRRFRTLVKELCPNVVHSYSFYTNFAAWLATRGTNATSVGSIRSDFMAEKRAAGTILGRLSAALPQCMISNSKAGGQCALQATGFKPRQIKVVRNGLDINLFDSQRKPAITPIILGIGSLLPHKRWDRLIQSVAQLYLTGIPVRLRLVGDGTERQKLDQQAKSLGLTGKVEFLGTRDDVPKLLAECALLAHTSDSEGCPNAVMEAMAAGRPVVATDAGDVPDLIKNGRTGFVVRRGDSVGLTESLSTLIHSPKLREAMGQAGRENAEKMFSLKRLAEETLAAYSDFQSWEFGHKPDRLTQPEIAEAASIASKPGSM